MPKRTDIPMSHITPYFIPVTFEATSGVKMAGAIIAFTDGGNSAVVLCSDDRFVLKNIRELKLDKE